MKHRQRIVRYAAAFGATLLIIVAFGCASAPPPAAPSCSDFTGTWNTTQGPLTIEQNGCAADGYFPSPTRFSSFRGVVTGNRLEFSWEGPTGSGMGAIYINETLDAFTGTFGAGTSLDDATWEGVRGVWPEGSPR